MWRSAALRRNRDDVPDGAGGRGCMDPDRPRLYVSDLCRLAALYYLFNIFDEMISPASDYFMCVGAFYLVIRYLALTEEASGTDRVYPASRSASAMAREAAVPSGRGAVKW